MSVLSSFIIDIDIERWSAASLLSLHDLICLR
jgi:hypothetical protein